MKAMLFSLMLVLACCTDLHAAAPQLDRHFAGKQGCFVLYDLGARKVIVRSSEEHCAERYVACSTFKIPLALMAYDKGVLKDENTMLKWDGKDHGIASWNRDHTAATWMRESVVWFSQRLTPKLGERTIKAYLKEFDYGNQDMSAGLTDAWLKNPGQPALKISADEQVRFLTRMWTGQLAVSERALELTKRLTYLESSPRGAILHGKTGSNRPEGVQLGWFVGHLSSAGREYVFALNFTRQVPASERELGGPVAKAMAREILTEMGLF